MKAFGITDRGAVRKENQDYFRYEVDAGGELLTAVLCDGMGGARAGAVASSLAADTFMSHAANSLDETSSGADVREILNEAISYANSRVYDRSFADYACMGMGCTLVSLMAVGKRAVIANVGDSRAYMFTKNVLTQITRDHSLVEDMIARGKLTVEQARRHPKRNIITRAVGVDASVRADLFEERFLPGTKFLLCSDGLSNMVEDLEICRVLAETEEPEAACTALMDLALKNGATDNVTLFLAQR
ncbi:MAG: Stp1/IreP family PP2C-type Ser/Thr phosphatase [Oscillospiraceae bacterium]|nr:Stp1/IreP family PP2C-type Ser/Thr phosphatase [Oscillospiraceae bacterium]